MVQARRRAPRLPAADRRAHIIEAAAFAFAELGFTAATTQIIAQRAGISEALLYRHFPSKTALYRAVLHGLMRQQDVDLDASPLEMTSLLDYVRAIRTFLRYEMAKRDGTEAAIGRRLMIASLAGNGSYAKLIYRRALRQRGPRLLAAALDQAAREGLRTHERIDPVNAFFLLAHVGAMLSITMVSGNRLAPYAGDDEAVLRDALLFCVRGLGISEEAVARIYTEDGA